MALIRKIVTLSSPGHRDVTKEVESRRAKPKSRLLLSLAQVLDSIRRVPCSSRGTPVLLWITFVCRKSSVQAFGKLRWVERDVVPMEQIWRTESKNYLAWSYLRWKFIGMPRVLFRDCPGPPPPPPLSSSSSRLLHGEDDLGRLAVALEKIHH